MGQPYWAALAFKVLSFSSAPFLSGMASLKIPAVYSIGACVIRQDGRVETTIQPCALTQTTRNVNGVNTLVSKPIRALTCPLKRLRQGRRLD